jgi:predicted transcriptional regulator
MLDPQKREAAVMVRLATDVKQRLEKSAQANDRSCSAEASRALREHLLQQEQRP